MWSALRKILECPYVDWKILDRCEPGYGFGLGGVYPRPPIPQSRAIGNIPTPGRSVQTRSTGKGRFKRSVFKLKTKAKIKSEDEMGR